MATKISTIYTLISAKTDPLKRGLKTAHTESVKGAKKIQAALNKINFKALALSATAAAVAVGFAAKKFINLAIEQEAVEKRLGAVLKTTGFAAGFTLDQLKKMSAGMQQVTTTGDEVIMAGMGILATFKKIRGEAFERTTMAALDLSEVVGTDLNAAMIQLGKALNDPVANLGALSRAGIQFTKDQKAVIKQLWLTGQEAKAQGIILDELESQFGGVAKAARDTFGGAVKSLGNTLGDIGEKIGFALMPPIQEMVDSFASWLAINDKLINQDIPGFITSVGNAAGTTAKFLYQMNRALDIGIGGKLQNSVIEEDLKQLKEVEKKYIDQEKRLEAVGWTGGAAYKKIQQELSLVRAKIKLVNEEVAGVLRKEFFGDKKVGPMDAHIKAYYAMLKEVDPNVQKLLDAAAVENRKRTTAGMDYGKAYSGDSIAQDELQSNEETIMALTDNWATFNNEQVQEASRLSAEKAEILRQYEEENRGIMGSMLELSERTAWSMQENFSNVFFDSMTGELKNFGDYAKSILTSIQRAIADVTSQMITTGLFGNNMKGGGWLSGLGSLFNGGPTGASSSLGYGFTNNGGQTAGFRASGGPVSGGSPYVVGEEGPELFVPGRDGNIIPGKSGVKIDVNVVNNLGQEADVSQSSELDITRANGYRYYSKQKNDLTWFSSKYEDLI